MRLPYCKHCNHPAHRADCGVDDCGCVRYDPRDLAAREARKRTFLVDVKFFVKQPLDRERPTPREGDGGGRCGGDRDPAGEAGAPETSDSRCSDGGDGGAGEGEGTMKVAIYARVSTQEQSCENQLIELRRYAEARGGRSSRSMWMRGQRIEGSPSCFGPAAGGCTSPSR